MEWKGPWEQRHALPQSGKSRTCGMPACLRNRGIGTPTARFRFQVKYAIIWRHVALPWGRLCERARDKGNRISAVHNDQKHDKIHEH